MKKNWLFLNRKVLSHWPEWCWHQSELILIEQCFIPFSICCIIFSNSNILILRYFLTFFIHRYEILLHWIKRKGSIIGMCLWIFVDSAIRWKRFWWPNVLINSIDLALYTKNLCNSLNYNRLRLLLIRIVCNLQCILCKFTWISFVLFCAFIYTKYNYYKFVYSSKYS